MATTKVQTERVKTGRQGADRPWERPGQSAQDPSIEPPCREDRERQYESMGRRARVAQPPHEAVPGAKRPPRVERPTEDDIAQARLGGPKGARELKPAPPTKTEAEQTLPNDEPGHVA